MENNNTSQVIKATKATIKLGEVEIEVYQMPDGKYLLSKGQVVKCIGLSPKRLSQLLETTAVQTQLPQGLSLSGQKMTVVHTTKPIEPVTFLEASIIWQSQAFKGNLLAQGLVLACVTESLERRADSAFGVTQTETERNAKFNYIFEKVTRDERVAPFLRLDSEAKILGGTYLAKNLTKLINRCVFGTENFGNDRDSMTEQQQAAVCHLEKNIMRYWMQADKTAKDLVSCYDRAIGDFMSTYGDQFYQVKPKRSYKTAAAQAKAIQKWESEKREELEFSLRYR